LVCPGTDPSDAAGHAAAAEAPGRDAPRPSVRNGEATGKQQGCQARKKYSIWLFSIAMGNGPFIDDVPNLKMVIFQFAMLDGRKMCGNKG